jgi:hypothetical protein
MFARKKKHSPSNSAPSQSQPAHPWSAHTPPSGPVPSPFPRQFYALTTTATATGELFLFGGDTYDGIRNDLYVISTRDFSTTLFQTSGDIPGPRSGHRAVLANTILLILGGETKLHTHNQSNDDDPFYLLNLGASGLFHVKTCSS